MIYDSYMLFWYQTELFTQKMVPLEKWWGGRSTLFDPPHMELRGLLLSPATGKGGGGEVGQTLGRVWGDRRHRGTCGGPQARGRGRNWGGQRWIRADNDGPLEQTHKRRANCTLGSLLALSDFGCVVREISGVNTHQTMATLWDEAAGNTSVQR